MIHSLAGGELKEYQISNLVYVRLEHTDEKYWYTTDIADLQVGDFVLVPFGLIDELYKAEILKVENNVRSDMFPISFKRLKQVYKKAEQ